jgi:hypothetical protein
MIRRHKALKTEHTHAQTWFTSVVDQGFRPQLSAAATAMGFGLWSPDAELKLETEQCSTPIFCRQTCKRGAYLSSEASDMS